MTQLPGTSELTLSVQDGVLLITIARADHKNTVTYGVLDELLAAFAFAETSDDVRAIVVTGAGDTFSHGTDLRAPDGFSAGSGAFKPLRGGRRDVGGELAVAIYGSTRPVVAAINGTAVGIGVSMVLPMDIRVCSTTSRFAVPFVRRGIVPESCSTWFLPRIVGISTAMYWATTGRTFAADEAFARGLVQEVVAPEDVLPRALAIATDIAARSAPVAVALTRQMMWRGLSVDHPMTANELESEALLSLGAMPDAREGVQSFLERREPDFPTPASQTPAPYPWWDEPEFQPPGP